MAIDTGKKVTIEITQEACAALRSFLMNDRDGTGEGYSDFILMSIDVRRQVAALTAERDALRDQLKAMLNVFGHPDLPKGSVARYACDEARRVVLGEKG